MTCGWFGVCDGVPRVICPPRRNCMNDRRLSIASVAILGYNQMVETVFDKLHHAFALDRERPHQLDGFQTRLAAKVALHNFCIWLNRKGAAPRWLLLTCSVGNITYFTPSV